MRDIYKGVMFEDLWGRSAADLFAVGGIGDFAGFIYHFDGATWSRSYEAPLPLRGIWGDGAAVFAVGDAGSVFAYVGNQWIPRPSGTTETLHAVWGSGPEQVIAVGSSGSAIHYDGSAWGELGATGTAQTLNSVWGVSPTDVYAAGDGGVLLHYDRGAWSPSSSGTTAQLHAIWGRSATDVFVAGERGVLLRGSVAGWTRLDPPISYAINAVWGVPGTSTIYLAGPEGGMVLRRDLP